jgi:hypothetical protein
VTGATEFSIDNFLHRDIIGTRAHLETHLGMTDPALKSYAMKPVRINDGSDAFFFGVPVKHNVRVFCFKLRIHDQY